MENERVIVVGNLSKRGFVYFVAAEDGQRVKIGVTKNPEKRMKQLQTASPFKLKQLGLIESDFPYTLEKKLHLQYKSHRRNGEWFDIPEEMAYSIIKAHHNGLYQSDKLGILDAMEFFNQTAIHMTEAESQNPAEFYSYEDVDAFEESTNRFNATAMTGGDQYLVTMADIMRERLFLLLQSNAWGEPEVDMKEVARDIVGFHSIFNSYIHVNAYRFGL